MYLSSSYLCLMGGAASSSVASVSYPAELSRTDRLPVAESKDDSSVPTITPRDIAVRSLHHDVNNREGPDGAHGPSSPWTPD